jgi:response regulator RpfG family c-di-GMP phosphodiesterase
MPVEAKEPSAESTHDTAGGLPRILCVDDEPNVLQALQRQLRQRFSVTTAVGATVGLEAVKDQGPFAVVLSDLRMPEVDGVAFLRSVKGIAPETVRVLLTGQGDFPAAVAAVNEGHIFRFLTKPCSPPMLLQALEESAEQYRLVIAERVLLKETLRGSIHALMNILALANPAAYGRATRVKRYAMEVLGQIGQAEGWHVVIAAMLSQIGCVSLPPGTAEKLYQGQSLTGKEQSMVERLPEVSEQLLANIPRLEPVREILAFQAKRFDGQGPPAKPLRGEEIPPGARVLKLVLDYDLLRTGGRSHPAALAVLKERKGWYDPRLIEALSALPSKRQTEDAGEREVSLDQLQQGMVLAEDVKTLNGQLLIAQGHEVTVGLLARLRNLSEELRGKKPFRVMVMKR